jgi:hypothetical protein
MDPGNHSMFVFELRKLHPKRVIFQKGLRGEYLTIEIYKTHVPKWVAVEEVMAARRLLLGGKNSNRK